MSLYDEGHTIAGWTGFGVAAVGSGAVGWGVCTASLPLAGAGLAVVALSLLVTWVLHLAGWGKPPGVRPREQWGIRIRDARAREGHPACMSCRLAGRGREESFVAPAVVPVAESAEPAPLSPIE
ncbi:HGxxPAAW family protein [Streptomyces sp. NPDC046759]|uniref:HGxxPAAW family protein n=1 Tax=Streptomyces sp. NPDC046759 TaxID=3155019 RepID=UPI0033D07945